MSDYLYHYTSIETLLLILKNKTLRFNSLLNVDDLEEAQSKDIKQIGKICYVSCWTDDDSESIPMWNMYTPNMQGVRIRFKKYPFVKYHFKSGEYYFKEDVETYINYGKVFDDEKTTIVSTDPKLVKIQYTNDDALIYPKIKTVQNEFLRINEFKTQSIQNTKYSFEKIGKYKRKNWEFQKEVRYIINMSLWSMKELANCKNKEDQMKLISRLEDTKYQAPYNGFYLELTDDAMMDVEILMGPKVNESQEEMVKLIKERYCPSAKIYKSNLKIK